MRYPLILLASAIMATQIQALAEPGQVAQPNPVNTSSSEQASPPAPACGPPPEAFQACEGKNANTRSEFTSPRGDKVQGICQDDGHGKIVLRPDHPPKGAMPGGHPPPPEAYQACTGKTVGSRSQLTGPQGETITGTCMAENDKLVLRPDHAPQEGSNSPVHP